MSPGIVECILGDPFCSVEVVGIRRDGIEAVARPLNGVVDQPEGLTDKVSVLVASSLVVVCVKKDPCF